LDSLTLDRVATAPALPAEAPLAMPVQSLRTPPLKRRDHPTSPHGIALRRLAVIGGAFCLTVFAADQMYLVLNAAGLTIPDAAIIALFVALVGWIALSFTSALAGFVSLVSGGGWGLGIEPTGPLPTVTARTAILMPIYNEAPARVMSGLQAIDEALQATRAGAEFDIFILSDTTDPDVWIAEEAAFLALRERTGGHDRIFYRRRPANTARKAGNVAEWVQRFGAAYPHMLILDADSVMTADAIVRLAAAMERHPTVGLIQTLPVVVNGRTLFARLQQFAGRIYGPLIAHGIAWWHGAEGNYWGHNAIIRTSAFAGHAGLPELRGRKPLGGHILSHDFVEAALLRRAGWAIHMVPALQGGYEESPPSLTDLAIRDRRWCQGNLQHMAVLPARGLHFVSRMHLLLGIGSYLTAPLWLLFLLTGILIPVQAHFIPPDYFPNGRSLFPVWPVVDPIRSMWLFIGTTAVLLAPKLLGLIALLMDGAERRACGGAVRMVIGVVLETLVTGLLAPVMMLTQSATVVQTLLGHDSGWNAQRRDDGSIPLSAIVRRYWPHTAVGVLLAAASYVVSPLLSLWMSPVLLGLVLAVPLVAITGAVGPGRVLRRLGLLATPEERHEPDVLARARTLMADHRGEPTNAIHHLLADRALLAAHRAMLPPPRRPRLDPLDPALLLALAKIDEALSLDGAIASLSRRETASVLLNDAGLARLAELADAPGR
jgi:membrane glycosyltransferase